MTVSRHSSPDHAEQLQPPQLPHIDEVGGINPKIKQVLAEFKAALEELYGDRLASLVLYGSQARCEAAADSDVDVLVVLKGEVSPGDEIWRMGEASTKLLLQYDELVSTVPMAQDRFLHHETPLMRNVRQEGVLV